MGNAAAAIVELAPLLHSTSPFSSALNERSRGRRSETHHGFSVIQPINEERGLGVMVGSMTRLILLCWRIFCYLEATSIASKSMRKKPDVGDLKRIHGRQYHLHNPPKTNAERLGLGFELKKMETRLVFFRVARPHWNSTVLIRMLT